MFYKILEIHSLVPAKDCFVLKHYERSLRKPVYVEVCLFVLLTIRETKLGVESVVKKVIPVTHEQIGMLVVGGDAEELFVNGFELDIYGDNA